LRDKFYIEREADQHLKRQIIRPGSITTIRAPRQTGKSSLLVRGIFHARQMGATTISLDLQRVDREYLQSLDSFLRYLAEIITLELGLDTAVLDQA
jgi:hypothetical protein